MNTKILAALAVGVAVFGGTLAIASTDDSVYEVTVYRHNGDGVGKAMASLDDNGARMYDFVKRTDGKTLFCLEDVILNTCFTTDDRFNAGSVETQRLRFSPDNW